MNLHACFSISSLLQRCRMLRPTNSIKQSNNNLQKLHQSVEGLKLPSWYTSRALGFDPSESTPPPLPPHWR